MKGKIFLVLFIIGSIMGIQTAFAQQKDDAKPEAAKPAAQEKSVKKGGEVAINLNMASDDEFKKALDKAKDIELVNEGAAKPEESGKKTNESAKKSNKEGKKK